MTITWIRYIVAAALFVGPGVAAANAQVFTPAVSAGVGAGATFPLHGDFDFVPWTWEGDIRVALSRHVVLEGAGSEWRHARTTVTTDAPSSSPGSAIGRIEQTARHTRRTWYVSLLATGAADRVRVSGGAGVGVLQHHHRTVTQASHCSLDAVCGTFESSHTSVAAAVQGVGDIDVRLANHVFVFARVRLVVPAVDPSNSDIRLLTGVRWGW